VNLARGIDTSGAQMILWPDLPDNGVSAHLTTAAERLRTITYAAALPQPLDHREPDLSAATASGTRRLCHLLECATGGNWWDYQIGVPLRLADIGVLLHDEHPGLAPLIVGAITTACSERAPRTETGANLLWHTSVAAISGLLDRSTRLMVALAPALERALRVTEAGDGIHRDGSFLQHDRLAYTGGYGLSLLATAAPLLRLTTGTSYAPDKRTLDALLRWIESGVRPYVFDGVFSDAVRGREISRSATTGLDAGMIAAAALLEAAPGLDEPRSTQLRRVAKGWIGRAGAESFFRWAPSRSLRPGAVAEAAEVLADPALDPIPEPVAPAAHPDMARAVHRGDGFALALTATTTSIDSSEHINGENPTGWYAGFGTRYLHTRSDPRPFDGDYWPTVDPLALPGLARDDADPPPGTTVVNPRGTVRAEAVGQSLVFGWDLGRDTSDLSGHVSWLCHGSAAAMIVSGFGSGPGRRRTMTVENRLLGSRALLLDGVRIATESAADGPLDGRPTTVFLEGVGGFLAMNGTVLRVALHTRTGSWARINASPGTPRHLLTRRYVTITAEILSEPATVAVLLLPLADPDQLRRAATRAPVALSVTPAHHRAVFDGAVLTDVFAGEPTIGPITVPSEVVGA
jgi:hyaluronate lyase